MRARSLALAVLAVALCSCAATSHFAADTAKGNPSDPVPWISATPSSMLLPTPSPTMIPAGTRPCQAADLQAVFGGIGAFTGGQLAASILFGNRSASACVLQGVPALQLFDSAGHQIPLTTRTAEGMPSDPILVQPGTADVQAGSPRAGIGYAEIDWQTHDGAGTPCVPSPSEGSAVALSLPGGSGSLRISVSSDPMGRWNTIAPCYGRVAVSAFQHWPAPEASPTADPLESLTILIDAPSSVTRGSVLHYTVSLQNSGSQPVIFPADCPVYLEWEADSTRAFAKGLYLLNCRPVGTIAPGQSVRFAMQIPVPSGTQPGHYDLRWEFVGARDVFVRQGKATVTVSG
jgi:hypothetical protein